MKREPRHGGDDGRDRATAVPVTIVMSVDHPHIIVIREHLTGTVLFMGKVVKMP
jgi:serine protease inhibitor